jgi:branched-subunit amino acid ABC-type transport system permease component
MIPGYVPFVPTELSLLPPLVVMAGVLMVRPAGLFGVRQVERV